MPTYYQKLVTELGADGARAYMKDLRSRVKKPGYASMSRERVVAAGRKGGKNRWKNHENKETDNNATPQEGLEEL